MAQIAAEISVIEPPTEEPSRQATKVLQEVMLFHDKKAKFIITQIIKALKEDKKQRGDLMALMYKKFAEATAISVDCANKLAPYQSAKLSSIEVKSQVEHRYVLRAPSQAKSNEDWFTQIGNIPEQPKFIIDVETDTKQHPRLIKEEIEDAEELIYIADEDDSEQEDYTGIDI